MAMRSEKIAFPGARGAELAARLDLPEGEPAAFALFAHCFTCSKDTLAASRISTALAARGVAVLRFDFTGLGGSEGDFANTDFSSNVGDLVAAADHLRRTRAAPVLLIGHSLGGAAVLAAAARISEVKAVATISAPAEPSHVLRLLAPAIAGIEAEGKAEVTLQGRRFTIHREFLDDIERHKLEAAIRDLRKALLVFHAPLDDVVGIDNATRIFVGAKHPKSFVSLDDADHLLTRKDDADYVARVISAWAMRYLGVAEVETPSAVAAPPEGEVVVEEAGSGKFANIVRVGRHVLRADEPLAAGGTDTGPGPYDYLLAGLGACTAMTLRMYASHKGLPLDKVSVRLKHDKVHAEDCAECETREGRIDKIERVVSLDGALNDEQRKRLLEIADKCPVHRTLQSEIWIATRLG